MTPTQIRILTIGDSGVGKTSLIYKICHNTPTNTPLKWTFGCDVQVKLVIPSTGCSRGTSSDDSSPCFIEFIDVGCHEKCKISRKLYFSNIDAIILVYDMSNRKSFLNIRKWIAELSREIVNPASNSREYNFRGSKRPDIHHRSSATGGGFNDKMPVKNVADNLQPKIEKMLCFLPVLVVGNKSDMVRKQADAKTVKAFGYNNTSACATSQSVEDLEEINQFIQKVVITRGGKPAYSETDIAYML